MKYIFTYKLQNKSTNSWMDRYGLGLRNGSVAGLFTPWRRAANGREALKGPGLPGGLQNDFEQRQNLRHLRHRCGLVSTNIWVVSKIGIYIYIYIPKWMGL